MFDIKSYLDDRGIEWFPGGSENTSADFISIQCPNPLCHDEKNHCGINPDELYFNCWVCGEKGNINQIIKWIEDCNWYEVRSIISEFQIDDIIEEPEPKRIIRPRNIKNRLPSGCSKEFPKLHYNYLKKRNYDPDYLINKYDLYATQFTGKYRYRVIIPYYLNGQIVTYSGKDITGKSEIPYKHCKKEESILHPKQMLYNIDNCKSTCAVLEGVFDVWRIGDGAVATSGIEFTDEQVDMLIGYGFKRIIVVYDHGAEEHGYRLAKQLSLVVPEVLQVELLRGDPDTLPQEDIEYIRSLL
jgi:hypothetical protein